MERTDEEIVEVIFQAIFPFAKTSLTSYQQKERGKKKRKVHEYHKEQSRTNFRGMYAIRRKYSLEVLTR